MNREAAALGVPVYSIFRGKMGAVDRLLERQGRLTMIQTVDEVRTKIRLAKRERSSAPNIERVTALDDIVTQIEEISRIERKSPSAPKATRQ